MAFLEKFATPAAVTILGGVMVWFIVGSTHQQSETLGRHGALLEANGTGLIKIEDKFAVIEQEFKNLRSELKVSFETARTEAAVHATETNNAIAQISGHLRAASLDIDGMLINLGVVRPHDKISASIVDGRIIVFPMADASYEFLSASGLPKVEVAPAITGFDTYHVSKIDFGIPNPNLNDIPWPDFEQGVFRITPSVE